MKKIIFMMLSLILTTQANALTLADCKKLSNDDIADMFMRSIALGGQSGSGNKSCMQDARSLKVSTVADGYEGLNPVVIDSKANYSFKVYPGNKETMFEPIVSYKLFKGTRTLGEGEFTFARHNEFKYADSINELKCASASMPDVPFMFKRCF